MFKRKNYKIVLWYLELSIKMREKRIVHGRTDNNTDVRVQERRRYRTRILRTP